MNTYNPDERVSAPAASAAAGSTAGQFLIFYLGREEYGIHVPRIREIISLVPLELAPGLPYCVRGVVSILGKTIPVVDLRLKLGLAESPPPANRTLKKDPDSTWIAGEYPGGGGGPDQCPGPGFIVVIDAGIGPSESGPDNRETRGGGPIVRSFGDLSIEFNFAGIVVDCISEIVTIRPEDIEPVSSAKGRAVPDCILGLVKLGQRTRTLLDIDLALSLDSAPEYAYSRTLAPLR